jgi:serine/threonine protein phosphatase PrpC
MPLRTVARSITGPRRSRNEDAVLVDESGGWHLLVVADGMGGHRAGDVASEEASDTFATAVGRRLSNGAAPESALPDAVDRAHEHLRELERENPGYEGMGTTLVAALYHEGTAWVVNVGDSRGYHYEADELERVTDDHTVVRELVEAGEITPAEAKLHAERNVLTQSVGADGDPEPDLFEVTLTGTLMLCTDGLPEAIGEPGIATVLASDEPLADRADDMTETAVNAGASDNITLAMATETPPED